MLFILFLETCPFALLFDVMITGGATNASMQAEEGWACRVEARKMEGREKRGKGRKQGRQGREGCRWGRHGRHGE